MTSGDSKGTLRIVMRLLRLQMKWLWKSSAGAMVGRDSGKSLVLEVRKEIQRDFGMTKAGEAG